MQFTIFKNNKYSTIEDILDQLDELYLDKHLDQVHNSNGEVNSDILAKIAIREEIIKNLSK